MKKETTLLKSVMLYQTYKHDIGSFVNEKQSNHGNQDVMNEREDMLRPLDKLWLPLPLSRLGMPMRYLQDVEWITRVPFSPSS